MKPAPFEYDAPQSEDEVLDLLARYGDECKLLAGGQSLVPLMNFRLARPGRLIDLNGVASLAGIRFDGDSVIIGAMTRHAALERSTGAASSWPLLVEAVGWVGHMQIRNRGTVGGSVAHADPAAELPAAMAALDATFHVRSKRASRVLTWDQLFISDFTTAIAADELLTAIEVPSQPSGRSTAFVEFARRHGDFALGGAAVTLELDDSGVCKRSTIALLSAGPRTMRAAAAEQALAGVRVDSRSISAAAAAAVEGLAPAGDMHGSTEYRVGLLRVMTERALTKAAERAKSNT